MRTRGGHDIADQLPELDALSDLGVDVVLDGELVAGAGRPADFSTLAGAISSRRHNRAVLTYVPFDVLRLDGCWLIDEPYIDRRRVLERLSELGDGDVPIPGILLLPVR